MDIHKNARLTLISREELAKRVSQQGWTLKAAAAAFNVSAKTAAKWVGRYRELGREGLGTARRDRSARRAAPAPIGWRRSRRCGGSAGPACASR